jgi:hypothetical protein
MRPTIVLLSAPDDHQRIMARLRQAGVYRDGKIFDRLDRGDCAFHIDASGDVLSEFDADELDEISQRIGEFRTILVEYSEVSCLRDLLSELLTGVAGVLDTNYGEFLDYAEVLARFRREPGWDWRSAAAT